MSWGYTAANGPSTWSKGFPGAAGHAQSPVDIKTGAAQFDSSLGSMTLSYKAEAQYTANNTGSSFKVDLQNVSELSGGPVNGCYKLEQFHLHWGTSDKEGSEHTIDGNKHSAELHFVHWNSSKYASFSEASSKADGLAVLGVMIQAGAQNAAFQQMVDVSKEVNASGQSCEVKQNINTAALLPGNTSEFWTYHGSLTTPPCNESVQWIVFKEVVQYAPSQLQALRSLLSGDAAGGCITSNHRPTMPLGDRHISASFK